MCVCVCACVMVYMCVVCVCVYICYMDFDVYQWWKHRIAQDNSYSWIYVMFYYYATKILKRFEIVARLVYKRFEERK